MSKTKLGASICLLLALCTAIYVAQFHWQQAVASAQWRSALEGRPTTALTILLQAPGAYCWLLAPFLTAIGLASWQCLTRGKRWFSLYALTLVNVIAACLYWLVTGRQPDANAGFLLAMLPVYQWLFAASIWGLLKLARRWLAPN